MQTECTTEPMEFHSLGRREVIGKFDDEKISSDGGGVLLREVENRRHILKRLSLCFRDHRNPKLIEHTVESLTVTSHVIIFPEGVILYSGPEILFLTSSVGETKGARRATEVSLTDARRARGSRRFFQSSLGRRS